MKKIITTWFIISGILMTACKSKQEQMVIINDTAYFEAVRKDRAETNIYFMSTSGPLNDSVRAGFDGVQYFPIDTNFRVIANFIKVPAGEKFEFATTGTIKDTYLHVGNLQFTVQQTPCTLAVYENQNLKSAGQIIYFVPFFDATNSQETYGGGRYLDFSEITTEKVIVDFNMAYQPYCFYNHEYSCPIPPAKNKLPIAIRAGERM